MRDAQDQRLLTLVGCIRGIVLELDGDARYLNAWADDPTLLALPAEQMIGKTIDEVLGPAGPPFTAMVHRVYATGVVEHLEYPLDVPSGRRWFFADVKRVGTLDTTMTVVFFARDITERKATEEALARSEERYRLAAQATNDVLWDWDIATGRITWNASAAEVFHDAVEDDLQWWRDRIHSEDRAHVIETLEVALSTGVTAWSGSYRFRRGDGTYADFVDRGFISRDEAGRAVRMVGSMTDVTPINLLQAQLRRADRLAALGTLAAGVGHEINNPLTYVLGNLDNALELIDGADADVIDSLKEARDGARRIAEIVKSLKMVTSRDDQEIRVLDVHNVLEAAIRMADKQIRERARLVREHENTPCVRANEAQLSQVFLNLLINAAQALDDGSPETNTIRVRTSTDANGRVAISISDTGCGIPPENLARIFDPFFTTKPVGGGTGLGLSICMGIVDKLGGEISVASDVGKGTTFTVTLPAHQAPTAALPRVLVIDDEIQIGKLVARMFRNSADVLALTSAREGLSRLKTERFDLVLCDLMMPDMSGIDLYHELHRNHPALLRRVFFMTGGAFTPRVQDFLDAIGAACIDKPLDRTRLLSLLSTQR